MTTDVKVLKACRLLVYNYRKGRRLPSQLRFVIGKFNGRYLCATSSNKYSNGCPFDTEWFDFKETE